MSTRGAVLFEVSEIDSLTRKRVELVRIRDSFSENTTNLGKTASELKKIYHKYGKKQAVEFTLRGIGEQKDRLKKERGQVDSRLRVINDAIEYLGKTIENICPVCGSDIKRDQILGNLKLQIAKYKTKTIKGIDKRLRFLERQEGTLEDILSDLEKFEGEFKELGGTKSRLIGEVSEIAGKKLGEREARVFLRREIGNATARINRLQRAYRTKERVLQNVERGTEKIKAIYDVVSTKDRFNQLSRVTSGEAKEMKRLDKKIRELNALKNRLVKIADAITTTQTKLAEGMIQKASPKIDQFYSLLGGHPYYKRLRIIVQPRKTGGGVKNSYQIKADHPTEKISTFVSDEFSASQMNCTALSIFLGMSVSFSRRLGFIILDDPSQSLDSGQKIALVKLLRDKLGHRQLFVSSQDSELERFLLQQMPRRERIVYNFIGWDKTGPRLKIN